jgi:hypothetical protein
LLIVAPLLIFAIISRTSWERALIISPVSSSPRLLAFGAFSAASVSPAVCSGSAPGSTAALFMLASTAAFSAASTFSAAAVFSDILGLASLFLLLEEGRDLLEDGRETFGD